MSMGIDTARHLTHRLGFGPTSERLEQLADANLSDAVGDALDGVQLVAATPPPEWIGEAIPRPGDRRANREEFQMRRRQRAMELKAWWYRELLSTHSPLTEQLTLFWHNHFTSSLQKVKHAPAIYRQNVLLRRHAVGNFGELLRSIARDPAMLAYLDVLNSDADSPNENFARELLELFTLGEGHYTEDDIRQAARAFTGWVFRRREGTINYRPRRHDGGIKTFLGRSGAFDGDDIVTILLDQPRTAVHIVEKLWHHFVSPVPDDALVESLAATFREADYELRPLLERLFTLPAFTDRANHGTLVKSPVDLVVGTSRFMGLHYGHEWEDLRPLIRTGRQLGQDLLDPPNVKGWPGGEAWITTSSLMLRQQTLRRAMQRSEAVFRANRERWSGDTLIALLLPVDPVYPPRADAGRLDTLEAVLLDPAYQLK